MPDHCCVPKCNSNYAGTENYVSVYKFPTDEAKKQLWCRKIPRANFIPSKRSVVCEKHFREDMTVREDVFTDKNGTISRIPRKRPMLKEDAYPCIFNGCPMYMTENPPALRRSRTEKLMEKEEEIFTRFTENDKINGFDKLLTNVDIKIRETLKKNTKFIVYKNSGELFVIFLCFCPAPLIQKCLKISKEMNVEIFYDNKPVYLDKVKHILNEVPKITLWSEFQNILTFVENLTNNNDIPENNFETAVKYWRAVIQKEDDVQEYNDGQFILEQMKLFEKSSRGKRYSSYLTAFAYSLYMKSTSCYEAVLASNLVKLPSVRHLKRLTSLLKLNQAMIDAKNIAYVKSKCKALSTKEREVNLLIDEIHIKPKIAYKGKALSGFAENKVNEEATTIQAFMISSLFSKYKEIIGLVPVLNMTAEDLFHLTKQALQLLNDAGFNVVCLIADNNRINRNMFSKLSFSQSSNSNFCMANPADESKKLFVMFDSVHIIKCIRNNWLNQSNLEKTFLFPKFENLQEVSKADFCLLRKVFNIERDLVAKIGYKLNFKAVYPSNIEKQNVNLALKIFDDTTSAAVELYSQQDSSFVNGETTASFIKVIKKWWNIMNVKHPKKGIFIANPDCYVLKSVSDERFNFLENFILWLEAWQNLKLKPRCGCLSEETFFALIHTTKCMISVSKHLLSNGTQYVLTGKFQTDCLESRFGLYRQMSGSTFHVTAQDILESERKLRVKSVLILHSDMLGNVPIKCLFDEMSSVANPVTCDLSVFDDIQSDVELNVSMNEQQALIYIAGYCVHSLKLQCVICKEKTLSLDNLLIEGGDYDNLPLSQTTETQDKCTYLDMVSRGGLKKPSILVLSIIIHSCCIFRKLISKKYETHFQKCQNQHSVITSLFKIFISNSGLLGNEICQSCNCDFFNIIIKMLNTFANICLNNYTKVLEDSKFSASNERKLKKFKKH